jgi:hypothetical protein
MIIKPKLYIHTGRATHFLSWEIKEFKKHFRLVDAPSSTTALLSFGPDILREASGLPASKRFAVLFPGFGHNPLYNHDLLPSQLKIINQKFEHIFINKGPLELAYKSLDKEKVSLYPFSIDTSILGKFHPRSSLQSLLHVSNDAPQKDWRRSEAIMSKTGLKHEVYPPRDISIGLSKTNHKNSTNSRTKAGDGPKPTMPSGYVDHNDVIEKYKQYDGFVHVARDIKDRVHIDGKYTASLIEAGATGAILFWHDTFQLGNDIETVIELPLDEDEAAAKILNISKTLDIKKHSKLTRREILGKFNVKKSVAVRAKKIKELL